MSATDPLVDLLMNHGSMGYGAGSPIRCQCRKVLKGEMGDRYRLLAQHQVEVLQKAGALAQEAS